jgi:CTP synthase (UTP-ammonia lyase)
MGYVALIGDYSPAVTAHAAIPASLAACGFEGQFEWVESRSLGGAHLGNCAGIWVVPGSPYRDGRAVIRAIRFAREAGVPFLGTCGGYQHAIMEAAESFWGVTRATHAEEEPEAERPVISPLACGLVEVDADVFFKEGSRLRSICGAVSSTERYHCRYGFNRAYEDRLINGPLRAAAHDVAGEVRAVELDGHPFFIGTSFQPERAGLRGEAHPLIRAFIDAVRA